MKTLIVAILLVLAPPNGAPADGPSPLETGAAVPLDLVGTDQHGNVVRLSGPGPMYLAEITDTTGIDITANVYIGPEGAFLRFHGESEIYPGRIASAQPGLKTFWRYVDLHWTFPGDV